MVWRNAIGWIQLYHYFHFKAHKYIIEKKKMLGWGNIAANIEMSGEILGVKLNFLCRVPFITDCCKL